MFVSLIKEMMDKKKSPICVLLNNVVFLLQFMQILNRLLFFRKTK